MPGSVSCNSGSPGFFHTDNSYWRAFNMATFTGGQAYNVTSVSFGIETAIAATGLDSTGDGASLYANHWSLPRRDSDPDCHHDGECGQPDAHGLHRAHGGYASRPERPS